MFAFTCALVGQIGSWPNIKYRKFALVRIVPLTVLGLTRNLTARSLIGKPCLNLTKNRKNWSIEDNDISVLKLEMRALNF